MKTQRYKLLTTLIVSALHPNEPHQAGTEWAPKNVLDIREADELVTAGFAEKVGGDSKSPLASLVLDRKEEARRRQEAIDRGENPDEGDTTAETVVTDDNGGNTEEAVLTLILEGNIDQVKSELPGLTEPQLQRLAELELAGQGRKGVAEAIEAAVAELSAE